MPNGSSGSESDPKAAENFVAFLEGWLVRQEHYLDELLSCRSSPESDMRELVTRILTHYQQYYDEKSKVTTGNIFLVFSPAWFTALERSFMWIAGFKPGLAFSLLAEAVDDLGLDQSQAVDRLAKETRAKERQLADEVAKIQESVGVPPLLDIARRGRRPIDGEIANEDTAMEALRASLEAVVTAADSLRMRTALDVVDVLRPDQNVKFLAMAAQLQLKIRSWGLARRSSADI